jgi:hypothetical protein
VIDGAIRISGDFYSLSIFNVNQDPAASVAHPAITLNHRVIAVNLHLAGNVGVSKFRHTCPFLLVKILQNRLKIGDRGPGKYDSSDFFADLSIKKTLTILLTVSL